jgi:hypothetical protein
MTLSTLLIWVLTLQRMWLGLDIPYDPINVVAAREWVDHMGEVSVDLGYAERNRWVPVIIEEYRPRMPAHYMIVRAGLEPREVYEVIEGLSRPPVNWRGGAAACGGQTIIFNPAWLSETWLFYGSPIWMSVAAHERAHIEHGCHPYNLVETEQAATLMGFNMLGASDRPEAYLAFIAGLREAAIAATVVYTNDIWLLESLELTAGEREYFDSILAQCQINRDYCLERSEKYWVGPLSRMEIIREPGVVIFAIPDMLRDTHD